MNVAVVYCYPMVNARIYFPLAKRFIETYRKFPAEYSHQLYIGCNGGPMTELQKEIFDGIDIEMIVRGNSGWDIGLYQYAAEKIPCDLLVCLGAPVHFYKNGWLVRMVDAYVENGPGLYGCWGVPYRSYHHIRTTAFWLPPEILNSYPLIISSNKASRYDFEHGINNITNFSEKYGLNALMVTWTGSYKRSEWKSANGGPGQCLLFDQFTHYGHQPFNR